MGRTLEQPPQVLGAGQPDDALLERIGGQRAGSHQPLAERGIGGALGDVDAAAIGVDGDHGRRTADHLPGEATLADRVDHDPARPWEGAHDAEHVGAVADSGDAAGVGCVGAHAAPASARVRGSRWSRSRRSSTDSNASITTERPDSWWISWHGTTASLASVPS